jgi:RNA polymerase sigma-54 factor
MRLSFGQTQIQTQKQVLAPRMIQSMEILQLPILALQERIEQEMAENPTLEIDDQTSQSDELESTDETDSSSADSEESTPEAEKELVVDETSNNEDDFERLLELNEQFPETFDERPRISASRIQEDGDRKHDAMVNMAERPQTLQDYLHDQLGWFELDASLRQMCDRIIYNLDGDGRLPGRLEDVLPPDAGEEQVTLAHEALKLIQRLDPPGVGARDLRECLLLQLTPGMPYYEELKTLISGHLEDLEHNRMPLIQRKTGYSIEQIQAAWDELKTLNPRPGREFSSTVVANVVPDVFIDPDEEGGFKVRLEDGDTPSLYISPHYRRLLSSGQADEKLREYIKRKVNAAQWLIESIEQRRSTVRRVAQAIVDHQIEFLRKGPEAIEPLKMQQIADKVGVHVTTVSRAVDDKWMQTPRGIFPLRKFFVGGTVGADGEEVAWDKVRLQLQEVIDGEDKLKPYSDDELVKQLAERGVKVARRTVTKYRKNMNIPSSRERKDWSLAESNDSNGKS